MAQAYIVPEGSPPRWAAELVQLQDSVIEPLARTEDFGAAYGFAPAIESLRVIRQFVTALAWQDPLYEKSNLDRDVSGHLVEVQKICDEIRNFDGLGDAAVRRQNILTRLDNERGWIAGEVGPAIRVPELTQSAAALHETIQSAATAKTELEAIKDLVSTVREVAGREGASALGQSFTKQAKSHQDAALLFLGGAAVSLLLLLGAAYYVFVHDPISLAVTSQTDWAEFTRQLLPRVFLLGVAAYLVRFCARNYTVNKHLQVSNEQRANILRTYPALVGAGTTDVQRDRMAVVLATAAVATIESGYLKHPEDRGLESSALAAIEVLRQ